MSLMLTVHIYTHFILFFNMVAIRLPMTHGVAKSKCYNNNGTHNDMFIKSYCMYACVIIKLLLK